MSQIDHPADAAASQLSANVTRPNDEFYTPLEHVERARRVLGAIDLDPASCATANEVVGASTYYTIVDDGLAKPWRGRVFCNPPYSAAKAWMVRLLGEYEAGSVTAAIAVVNARTDTRWHQTWAERAWRCEVRGRVPFWRPDREKQRGGKIGTTVFYLGPEARRFRREFAPLGPVTAPLVLAVTRRCACGREFAGRADAMYCSAACKQRAYRRRCAA